MSSPRRGKPTTISEKTEQLRRKNKETKDRLNALAEEGFELLEGNAKFAYKMHDRVRAAATLNFNSRHSKAFIYLNQKPLDQILAILRRRAETDPALAKYIRPLSKTRSHGWVDDPNAKAKSRILLALAVKIRVIATGGTGDNNEPMDYREAIEVAISELAFELGEIKHSGVNGIEKLLTNMVFTIEDEEDLRHHLQNTVVSIGEALVCDEKLWFYSGAADGWVRLVITKPDRVGHWFYMAVVKLSNGAYYVIYLRLHRTVNTLANEQTPLPVDQIGEDWLSILQRSEPEIAEPFLIADSYYMSEAMREKIKDSGLPAIIAVPPERWPSVISVLSPKLNAAGDSASLYNEETDEVRFISFIFDCNHI
jgi:hypothetical protein